MNVTNFIKCHCGMIARQTYIRKEMPGLLIKRFECPKGHRYGMKIEHIELEIVKTQQELF